MTSRHLLPALGFLAAVPLFAQPPEPPPKHLGPPPPPLNVENTEKLVGQLGSQNPDEWAEAVRRLSQAPEAVRDLRRGAEKAPSADARDRARVALAAVEKDLARKRLTKLDDYAKNRQVDRLIETMAYWRESLTNEDRLPPRTLGSSLLAACRQEFKDETPKVRFWPIQHSGGLLTGTRLTRSYHSTDVVAQSVDHNHQLGLGFTVLRDASKAGSCMCPCFVNGDLSLSTPGFGDAVVFCNGDLKLNRPCPPRDSVIICTGDFFCEVSVQPNCLIVAGGEITIEGNVHENVFRHPKEKKLTDLVKLYDCRGGGLEVAVADKAVRVTAADPARPFGKAGLQKEDVIERVDGRPVADVRTFNKLLCRAAVGASGEALLSVRRGGQVTEIKVQVPE